ncbi:MAG: S9 family peptidase [Candidatus Dormibacteraeota bacterium]|nr:S9 family peptidase [Candidatus Dormibacteraeota bacterium]
MPELTLEGFAALPRVNGLLLSPDGSRVVLQVQTLSPDGTRFRTALWGAPSDFSEPARRLTFSEQGEGDAGFLPDGELVFTSARPDVAAKEDPGAGRLFLLPRGGGEARALTTLPGGLSGVTCARRAASVVVSAPFFGTSDGAEADEKKEKARKEAGVTALLHEEFPVRFWDHDLGPRRTRLLRLRLEPDPSGETPYRPAGHPEDLTPDAGGALLEASYDVSPDGTRVVSTWATDVEPALLELQLVLLEGGKRRTLASGADFGSPAFSPDGSRIVTQRMERGTLEGPGHVTLWLFDLTTGQDRELISGFDRWPGAPVWSADGETVYFVADDGGRAPIFAVPASGGTPRRLTEEGCFASLRPAPDGGLFALRSGYHSPNEVCRLDPEGTVTALPTPGLPLDLPGSLTELSAAAGDGTPIRAWLALPATASAERPAPLVLWVHGGPLSSWNSWSWRWCPWLLVERGYAVLLPDPALSTGYGEAMIKRAWGIWGPQVQSDLDVITDEALRRPDLDATRTAMMGGSFGGYMANWIAGHSTRFRAIVSHAGLWDLLQFYGTTDTGPAWEEQLGDPRQNPERYVAASPVGAAGAISTPMLVIHGDRDYRVPIGEALRLWTDLRRRGVEAKFLYFPDENHWILTPGNARVWYETVLAFLGHHVLGEPWRRPDLL